MKNKIIEDKICKCSLWGEILHRNKGPQVVQIQRKSVLDNQSKKKFRIEKTLNSLFSLLTCMRKQTAPIQNTTQYQSDSRTKLLLERTLQPEKDQQNLYSYRLKSVRWHSHNISLCNQNSILLPAITSPAGTLCLDK